MNNASDSGTITKKGVEVVCPESCSTTRKSPRSHQHEDACTSNISLNLSVCDSNDLVLCIENYEEEMEFDNKQMSPHIVKEFIYLMLEERVKSAVKSCTFSKKQFEQFSVALTERTGGNWDWKYLQGKYHRLRGDWKVYRELREHNTGVGLDPDTGAIIASAGQWNTWNSRNRECNKFRKAGLPYYNELTELFVSSTATGDFARNDGQSAYNSDEERQVETDFRGTSVFTYHATAEGDFGPPLNATEVGRTSRKSGKRPMYSSGGSSGGRSSKQARSESIDKLISAWAGKVSNESSVGIDDVSITECMGYLNEMEVTDEQYVKAVQYFKDWTNRIVFKLSTPAKRLLLLKSLP